MKTLLLFALLHLGVTTALQAEAPKVIFGHKEFVEYQPGGLPLILSAPHGGTLRPDGLPDRTFGKVAQDSNTQELARLLREKISARYGAAPHLILCRLHRMKVDANREITEAAQGDPVAIQAWTDFQGFIKDARQKVITDFSHGLYIDLHGHRHPENRVEIGYLLTRTQLAVTNPALDADPAISGITSIRDLAMRTPVAFSELLRGQSSLGGMLEKRGFVCVPSPTVPAPRGLEDYFDGGYNTRTHGSLSGGPISGLQIECPWKGVRDEPKNLEKFAEALTEAIGDYWLAHFKTPLKGAVR